MATMNVVSAVPEQRTIAAVAFIGRTNQPIYFKSFTGGSEEYMKLHLACYAALDIIEEKLNERRQSSTQIATTASATPSTAIAKDPFLGMLMPVDEYKVFGYVTGTNISIITVVKDVLLREDRVRELFRNLHRLYSDTIVNPFTPLISTSTHEEEKLSSPTFEEALTRIMEAANGQIEYRGPVPL